LRYLRERFFTIEASRDHASGPALALRAAGHLQFRASAAATLLLLLGLDMRTSISAVVSALSNHGGHAVGLGTDMTWPQMPGLGKVLLMACMLLGRLEFYAVLVLFVPLAGRR
jgi:Trk-type K+ transport system membrane component